MQPNTWTPDQTSFLEANYKTLSFEKLGEVLNKTDQQIYAKAYRMNFMEEVEPAPKKFGEYMHFSVDEEDTPDNKRKKDYEDFFKNFKTRTAP